MFKLGVLLVTFLGGSSVYAGEPHANDLTSFTVRGSYSFPYEQIALVIFDSLEAKTKETQRDNGFISCKKRGKSIYALVECRINVLGAGRIELIHEPFIGFEITAHQKSLFAGLKSTNEEWLNCQENVCRFRLR